MVKKNKGRRNRHATRNNNNNNHVLKGVNNETVKINPNNNSSNNNGNTTVESSIDTIQRDNNIRTLDSNSNLSTTTSNTDNNVSNMVHQEAGQEEVNSSLASLVNNSSNLGPTLVNPQNIIEQSESGDSNSDIYSDTNNVTDDVNNVTDNTISESAENVDFSTFDDSNTMLVDNNDSGAVKILDKIVTYEMVGWWDDAEDKPYSRLRLHQKPPVIKFKQHVTGDTGGDNDTEVSIVVTRQLASQLATLFEAVQDSYDGKPVSDKHKKVKNWAYFVEYWKQMWKYNPVKVVFGTILTLVVLGSLIYVSFH